MSANITIGETITCSYTKPVNGYLRSQNTGIALLSFTNFPIKNMTLAYYKITDTMTGSAWTRLNAHTPDVGGAWTENTGAWYIGSATANKSLAYTPATQHFVTQALLSPNVDMKVDVTDFNNGFLVHRGGLCFRYKDNSNNWRLELVHTGNGADWHLELMKNGTKVGSDYVVTGMGAGNTKTMRILSNGSSIKAYWDNSATPCFDITDSANLSELKFGLASYCNSTGTGVIFDNLYVH